MVYLQKKWNVQHYQTSILRQYLTRKEYKKHKDITADLTIITKNIYSAKKKQLRTGLSIGERVYVLAERIKKKSAQGKFYKQSVQNISYFNKEKIFVNRAKQTIDKITYYWLKNSETNRKVVKRYFLLLKTIFTS